MMTDSTTELVEQPQTEPPYRERLSSAVNTISIGMSRGYSRGDVSALRRLNSKSWGAPIFWHIVTQILEPNGLVSPVGHRAQEDERRWAVLLASMALLQGQHTHQVPFGKGLAVAQVSPLRVERLLRAHGSALLDLVKSMAHQLSSKGVKFDQVGLVELVLSDGAPYEESIRRSIARSFYRIETR